MAIIATPVLSIFDCAKTLIENGVSYLLIEKPGGIDEAQIGELNRISRKHNSKVFIAYNRRFYQSVQEAKNIIQKMEEAIQYSLILQNGLMSFKE